MAVYKIFPIKDASIYSYYRTMNTGIDPILQVGNINVSTNYVPQVSRFLIKFDQSEIEDIINNKVNNSTFNATLKCFIAKAQGFNLDSTLEVFPLSGSWDNGTGEYLDSPITTNGVSWEYMSASGSSGTVWPTSSFGTYITASWSGSNTGGGVWYTGSSDTNNTNLNPTQSFGLRTKKDITLNVTNIISIWYSSSNSIGGFTDIANEGFIIKMEDSVEFTENTNIQPSMQFYSVDTNTIYPPQLEIKWDDQIYTTGSLTEISTDKLYIGLSNNPGTFYSESINRFRLNVREEFPVRTYQTSSVYTNNKRLNSGSLYAIKDLHTDEYVIDFDSNYTKISCDSEGNYFDVYMNGLEPERWYKILIQTTISGSTIVKDNDYTFKVVNG